MPDPKPRDYDYDLLPLLKDLVDDAPEPTTLDNVLTLGE